MEFSPDQNQAGTLQEAVKSAQAKKTEPLRLLQVVTDGAAAETVEGLLKKELPDGTIVEHAGSLKRAFEFLSTKSYDAVLLDLLQPDRRWLNRLRDAVRQRDATTPMILLSGGEPPANAAASKQDGASDFVFRSRLSGETLAPTVLAALKGHFGQLEDVPRQIQEKRLHPRYLTSSAVVVYRVGRDLAPGEESAGVVVDIGLSGVGLTCGKRLAVPGELAVVGVDCPDGIYRYATVRWQHARSTSEESHCGGQFVHGAEDVFQLSKLAPVLNSGSLTLTPRLRESVAQEWACRGVMRPVVVDQVMTCPRCQSLPTFRLGCPQCGSSRTDAVQLMHHFACAHVAPAFEYESSGQLVCPKCRARDLVVGSDFEHLSGPYQCLECEWSDVDVAMIGECLKCGQRFPGKEAHEQYVVQYHVDRLDPLALIQAT